MIDKKLFKSQEIFSKLYNIRIFSINFYGFSIRTGNFVSKVTHELRKLKPNDLRKFNKIKYGQMVVIKKNYAIGCLVLE